MHWIYLIHEFHNLSWITEIKELFHDILIYWDAPVFWWKPWCMFFRILWWIEISEQHLFEKNWIDSLFEIFCNIINVISIECVLAEYNYIEYFRCISLTKILWFVCHYSTKLSKFIHWLYLNLQRHLNLYTLLFSDVYAINYINLIPYCMMIIIIIQRIMFFFSFFFIIILWFSCLC